MTFNGNSIKIKQEGRYTWITVDGVELKGVTELDYHTSVEEVPMLEIKMYVGDIEIDIENESEEE